MGTRGTEEINALWIAFVNDQGEQEFYALYRRFFPYLLSVGLKINPDRSLVTDTLNQQFLHLWQQRARLNDVAYPLTYITTSFKRRLLKEGIAFYTGQELTDEHLELLTEQSPEQLSLLREADAVQQQKITNAIEQLSDRKQQLIRMKYFEGLSYAQMAVATGLSERTIYNKVHEAIKELRKLLVP
ncbi:RNA polymerase sigma factor [Chitinophaga rhizophila]|uniref:Sigma-70 family RNA polymerase sigma factor n=1 Tax=Chitinophaga rhizophila TaxID=2866212 RepID=A0ABS7G5C2_9BACT|nr:sigma-70 family RNA polymerase sigma factor [Chitinophaga rhizophila]MBW8682855.1 sigma-70 family RNA polymerase sigma factor [Chitinophaga rhizophila]